MQFLRRATAEFRVILIHPSCDACSQAPTRLMELQPQTPATTVCAAWNRPSCLSIMIIAKPSYSPFVSTKAPWNKTTPIGVVNETTQFRIISTITPNSIDGNRRWRYRNSYHLFPLSPPPAVTISYLALFSLTSCTQAC